MSVFAPDSWYPIVIGESDQSVAIVFACRGTQHVRFHNVGVLSGRAEPAVGVVSVLATQHVCVCAGFLVVGLRGHSACPIVVIIFTFNSTTRGKSIVQCKIGKLLLFFSLSFEIPSPTDLLNPQIIPAKRLCRDTTNNGASIKPYL